MSITEEIQDMFSSLVVRSVSDTCTILVLSGGYNNDIRRDNYSADKSFINSCRRADYKKNDDKKLKARLRAKARYERIKNNPEYLAYARHKTALWIKNNPEKKRINRRNSYLKTGK